MGRFEVKLITLVALVYGVNLITLSLATDDELKQYHDLVYTVKGPVVGLDKTIENLHKLRNMYRDDSRPIDIVTTTEGAKIDELLELLNVNEEKCTDDYVIHIKDLLWRMILRKNAYPYVEHQQKLQYDLCKSQAVKQLDEAVHNNLSPQDQTNVEALVDKIDHGYESRFYRSDVPNEVTAGILSYLESKHGPILDKVSEKAGKPKRSMVSSLLNESVEGLCDRVGRATSKSLELYDLFDSKEVAKKRQDGSIAKWYHIHENCSYILLRMQAIKGTVYEAIVENNH